MISCHIQVAKGEAPILHSIYPANHVCSLIRGYMDVEVIVNQYIAEVHSTACLFKSRLWCPSCSDLPARIRRSWQLYWENDTGANSAACLVTSCLGLYAILSMT